MTRSVARFSYVCATLATLYSLVDAPAARAVVVDFEAPTYATSGILGQQGWVTPSYAPTLNGTLEVSTVAPLAGSQSLRYARTDSNLGPFTASDVTQANVVTVAKDGTPVADLNVSFLISSSSLATQGFGYGVTGLFVSPDGPGGMTPFGMRLMNAGSTIPSVELFGSVGGVGGWYYFGGSLAAAAFPENETLEFDFDVDFDSSSYLVSYRNVTTNGAFTAPVGPFDFVNAFPADPSGHYSIDVIASFRFGAGQIDNVTLTGNLVPEPATAGLGLLALGAIATIRRRVK